MSDQELAVGGWMVRVVKFAWSEEAVELWFVVGEVGKHAAEQAVRNHPSLGADAIDARRMLGHKEIDALKLKPGEVRQCV